MTRPVLGGCWLHSAVTRTNVALASANFASNDSALTKCRSQVNPKPPEPRPSGSVELNVWWGSPRLDGGARKDGLMDSVLGEPETVDREGIRNTNGGFSHSHGQFAELGPAQPCEAAHSVSMNFRYFPESNLSDPSTSLSRASSTAVQCCRGIFSRHRKTGEFASR